MGFAFALPILRAGRRRDRGGDRRRSAGRQCDCVL